MQKSCTQSSTARVPTNPGWPADEFSEELETFYTLAIVDSALVAQHRRMDEDISLTPKREDAFTASAFFIRDVNFIRGEDGAVTGFTVSNGRTRDVLFEKMH